MAQAHTSLRLRNRRLPQLLKQARLIHDDGLPSVGSHDFKLAFRCQVPSHMRLVS